MRLRKTLTTLGLTAAAVGAFAAPAAAQAAPAAAPDSAVSAQGNMVFYDDYWKWSDCDAAGQNLVRHNIALFYTCEESWVDWDLYYQPK